MDGLQEFLTSPDGRTIVICGLIIFLSILATLYAIAMNDWQLTSIPQEHYAFIVSGDGSHLRTVPNVKEHFLDKEGVLLPIKNKDGGYNPAYEPEHVLARIFHRKLGIWYVSWIFPIQRVHSFLIPRLRLSTKVTDSNAPITAWVEQDPKPTREKKLLAYIQRPVLVRGAETSDNFTVDMLLMVIVKVVIPDILMFRIGTERFFTLLPSIIEGEAANYILTKSHADLVREAKGKGSPIIKAIESLNKSITRNTDGTLFKVELQVDDMTDVLSKVEVGGLAQTLGVEVIEGWVETFRPDSKATEATLKISVAQKEATERLIRANGIKDALIAEAEGKTAETRLLVDLYGNPTDARIERMTKNLGQGSNITTLVIGESAGVMLNTNPSSPTNPHRERSSNQTSSPESSVKPEEGTESTNT